MNAQRLDIDLHIHIGLPKCASSSIQSYLTDLNLPNYIGKFPHNTERKEENPYVTSEIKSFFRETILYEHELLLDDSVLFKHLQGLFEPYMNQKSPIIISDEELSGFCFWNNKFSRAPDILLILKRLKRFFKSLKVLLILREPQQFLRSYYHQMLKMGYNVAYHTFIDSMLVKRRELIQFFYLDRLITKANEEGIEVIALPLEGLGHEPKRFLTELSNFLEHECHSLPRVNQAPDQKTIYQLFQQNTTKPLFGLGYFTPYYQMIKTNRWLEEQKKSGKINFYYLSSETEVSLEKLILRSNDALQNQLGWDLESYGYRMS